MSREIDDLRRSLRETFGNDSDTLFLGVVSQMDETENTCTIIRDEGVCYYDVRLRTLINEKPHGLVVVPKVESTVIVGRIAGSNELFVAQCSEVDKVVVTIGENTEVVISEEGVAVNAEQVSFNGGENGAMVKIDALEKNLNSLKSYVEAMNSALPTAFTAVLASTAANGQLGANSYNAAMASKIIQIEQMGNDKVKH